MVKASLEKLPAYIHNYVKRVFGMEYLLSRFAEILPKPPVVKARFLFSASAYGLPPNRNRLTPNTTLNSV